MSKTKEYSNGEVTIVWQAEKCIHSERCWRGLNSVFDPDARPWINAEGASTKEIKEQIDKCPSGALSYYMNDEGPKESDGGAADRTHVQVMKDGPLLVHGDIVLEGKDGSKNEHSKTTALCRCGHSANKPFCDGSHNKEGFKDS